MAIANGEERILAETTLGAECGVFVVNKPGETLSDQAQIGASGTKFDSLVASAILKHDFRSDLLQHDSTDSRLAILSNHVEIMRFYALVELGKSKLVQILHELQQAEIHIHGKVLRLKELLNIAPDFCTTILNNLQAMRVPDANGNPAHEILLKLSTAKDLLLSGVRLVSQEANSSSELLEAKNTITDIISAAINTLGESFGSRRITGAGFCYVIHLLNQLSNINIKIKYHIPPNISDLALLGIVDLESAVALEQYITRLIKEYAAATASEENGAAKTPEVIRELLLLLKDR